MQTDSVAQTSVFNHWVPRSHLKRWSVDGLRVDAYQLLVPHEKVPMWTRRSIDYVAAVNHLYTTTRRADEPDAFEKWIKVEIEDPALEPLDKIINDRRLTRREWRRVTRYVMALDVRSPASYLESVSRWKTTIPGILSGVLNALPGQLARAKRCGEPLEPSHPPHPLAPDFPVRTWRKASESQPGMVELHASIVPGRELWLASMRHILTETVLKVGDVKWSVMRPSDGARWFTSDHPVLRLNYNSDTEYDFGGGWGNKGSEIIVPLSPTHLLYRQAGHQHEPQFVAKARQMQILRRLLAARAHRQIYAIEPTAELPKLRPRVVDAAAYKHEKAEWDAWHERQANAERDDDD